MHLSEGCPWRVLPVILALWSPDFPHAHPFEFAHAVVRPTHSNPPVLFGVFPIVPDKPSVQKSAFICTCRTYLGFGYKYLLMLLPSVCFRFVVICYCFCYFPPVSFHVQRKVHILHRLENGFCGLRCLQFRRHIRFQKISIIQPLPSLCQAV